jgi:Xaa-Pro aminopeptidase
VLEPNMTFQIDTFVTSPTFGLRWEKPVAITKDGCVNLAPSQIGTNGPIEVCN